MVPVENFFAREAGLRDETDKLGVESCRCLEAVGIFRLATVAGVEVERTLTVFFDHGEILL